MRDGYEESWCNYHLHLYSLFIAILQSNYCHWIGLTACQFDLGETQLIRERQNTLWLLHKLSQFQDKAFEQSLLRKHGNEPVSDACQGACACSVLAG